MKSTETRDVGRQVTLAGIGINLALGVLYSWSIISAAIPQEWGWKDADKALPYSVACMIFALTMIPAGRMQDRLRPSLVAGLGGLLVGIGCLIAWRAGSSLAGFVVGFGVFAGMGIGFGYAAATPPAVKWFPPSRTGLIAGLVVAGFGLASVYIAPLATYLTQRLGVSQTMLVLGVGFTIVVVSLAQFLKNPPPGFTPRARGSAEGAPPSAKGGAGHAAGHDLAWTSMLRTAQFWLLWFMFACGAAAGLMLISIAAKLGKASLGANAFLVVIALSIGNAGGRISAGILSDRIGRQWTMFAAFVLQAAMVLLLTVVPATAAVPLLLIVLLAGANYGANLSLFPSASKDYFGLKGFGLNYGLLFTAWGVGGMVLPWINGRIIDRYHSPRISFLLAGGLMVLAAGLTFVSRAVAARSRPVASAVGAPR